VHTIGIHITGVGHRVAETVQLSARERVQDPTRAAGPDLDNAVDDTGRVLVEWSTDDRFPRPVVVDVDQLADREAVTFARLVSAPGEQCPHWIVGRRRPGHDRNDQRRDDDRGSPM
jgi:hypothetical protein